MAISTLLKRWLDIPNTPLPKLLPPVSYIQLPWKMEHPIKISMIQQVDNSDTYEIPQKFIDTIRTDFHNHKIIYTYQNPTEN